MTQYQLPRACQWALALSAVLLTACETQVDRPLTGLAPFDYTPYCETVDRDTDLELPEEVALVLEDETAAYTEEETADAMLVSAALKVAHSAVDGGVCLNDFEAGEALAAQSLQKAHLEFRRLGNFRPASDAALREIQDTVTYHWQDEQSARNSLVSLRTEAEVGPEFWAVRRISAHTKRLDGQSSRLLDDLIETQGWIDRGRFGKDVSFRAWMLAQHADHRPELQRAALRNMEPYLAEGKVAPRNYAFLSDRVAVNAGQKQRYGTQPTWECDENGEMGIQPLEDPENVDQLRAEIGLGPLDDYAAQNSAQYCGGG